MIDIGGNNRLAALAADIQAAHAAAETAARARAGRAVEAGHALIEAKSLLKHGQWLPWLKDNCRLSERTAQLYMKLAKIGADDAVIALVSAIGLEAASPTIIIRIHSYDPFANCDAEGRRQWHLLALLGVPNEHIEWLLQKGFQTPDEWLGEEGVRCRRNWGMPEPSDVFKANWLAFQRQHQERPMVDIEAELDKLLA